MFRSNKLPLILLLLFLPLLTNCTENKSDSIGSVTELDIILDPNINFVTPEQIESSIYKFRIRGISESFFERVSIYRTVAGKIPRSKNLLLILESGSTLFNSTFSSLFDPQFLKTVNSSDNPVTLIKNDLFYLGQKVYIIVTGEKTPDPVKYLKTLSQLTDKIVESSIRSIRKEGVQNFNEELTQTLIDSLGISVQIPTGFEMTLLMNNTSSFLMRRGVGTKTEEWIVITPLNDSVISTIKENEFTQLRTKLLAHLIQFSDGSMMDTHTAVLIDAKALRFRGEWVTKPYPMAGSYSGKIVESKKGSFYIEAGIYSPGRPKTLNLLRLENTLNFNK
jgi:hypothetical protein